MVEALTEDRIQEFKTLRLESGVAEQTLNNDLGAVSILMTFATKKGLIKDRVEIKRYKAALRVRYLEKDQIGLYMAALRRPFRPLFQTLIGTGMRLGEAEKTRACDMVFDEDGTEIRVHRSKTTAGVRTVFVPEWVSSALKVHLAKNGLSEDDLLFPMPRRTVQGEHKRACKIAGIRDYTIHDHRHTAAVLMAKVGTPIPLIQEQLGHERIEQTMAYATFHPDYSDIRKYHQRVQERLGLNPEIQGTVWGTEE